MTQSELEKANAKYQDDETEFKHGPNKMKSLEEIKSELAVKYSQQFYGLPEDHSMNDFKSGFDAGVAAMQERLNEAEKVIAFYACGNNWTISARIKEEDQEKYSSTSTVTQKIVTFERGGKLARKLLTDLKRGGGVI